MCGFAPFAMAEQTTPDEDTSMMSRIFPISKFFRTLFKDSIDEKRENLEKNRDIRNKLIEEKIELKQTTDVAEKNELNIKFNQKKEEVKTPSEETEFSQFTESIENLEYIKERIDSRIEKFEESTADVSEAKDLTLMATARLENAKLILFEVSATTTEIFTPPLSATTTASTTITKKELLNNAVDDMKAAREYMVKAIDSLSVLMEI